jgi:enoyl-CoA hydratase
MIAPLRIGQRVSTTRVFSMDDVQTFAALSGDANPIHLDPEFARQSIFGRPIVHGLFTTSLFSRLLGEELPGPGTIYLGQSLSFVRPVFVGDEVTASVEVTNIRQDKPIVTLRTTVTTHDGIAVDGEAVVKVPGPVSPPGTAP